MVDRSDENECIPDSWPDSMLARNMLSLQPLTHGNNPSKNAQMICEEFMDYFCNEGAVPWQWGKCMPTTIDSLVNEE